MRLPGPGSVVSSIDIRFKRPCPGTENRLISDNLFIFENKKESVLVFSVDF
jgi:hypothetical protein